MIKHSIKSIIRTPKKSILFFALMALLSMFISIGAGMYYAAYNMLREADKTFTTVAELNFLGENTNDLEAFYERMNEKMADFDFQNLIKHPDVLTVDIQKSAYAYIEDKQINQNVTPLDNYVIIEVSSIRRFNESFYQAVISKAHFGRTMRENTYVYINDIDLLGNAIGYDFVSGHKYLIIGSLSNGKNPTPIVSPGLPNGIEGFRYVIDLSEDPDFFLSEEGKKMLKLAEACHVVDQSLPVTMVSSLEASDPYFNRQMIIGKGREFLPEEYYEGNNNVIIISKTIADFYNLDIGDKIELKLHYAKKGTGLSDYIREYTFSNVADYRIVGIFENKEADRYTIYMPKADWIKQDFHSSVLARFQVRNGRSGKFIDAVRKYLLPEMEFAVYDQGYEAATKPIMELKDTSVLILVLSGLSGTAIILLFSYLLVFKQKDTIINMLSLGAGKKRVIVYILCGSAVLLLAASTTGALITSGFLNDLTDKLYNRMSSLYSTDLRYSERAIGVKLAFDATVEVNRWIPFIIILSVMLVSFLILFIFTFYIISQDLYKARGIKKPDKNKKVKTVQNVSISTAKKEHNVLFGSVRPIPLKFALVSLIRNSGRSFIVPVISLILSVFLVFLGFITNLQKTKRASVYDNIPVNAYMTTFKNETRDIGGLNLTYDIYRLIDPEYSYRMGWNSQLYESIVIEGRYSSLEADEERKKLLESSEFFKEMYLYTAVHYEYMGISKTRDGNENTEISKIPNIRNHKDAFGFDWFLNAIGKMPKLAYADDIRYTPDFFNSQSYDVNFLSGYGFDSLRLKENVAIIPSNFAQNNGIELGDTIRITGWDDYDRYAICSVQDLLVIGIYNQTWQSDVIYVPWLKSYDHFYFVDYLYPLDWDENKDYFWEAVWNELIPRDVRAATFTLKNTENLDAFREYLEEHGYSEAGIIKYLRTAVVIQDKNLEDTIKTLDNYIRLMEILTPIMLVLFGIIGFIVSYLLIRNRISELAIMRSMGTGKVSVFLSYFLEQVILFAVGLIPVIVFSLISPEYYAYYRTSLGYFILSYLAGSGLALIYLNRADLLDILFTKE